MRPSSANRHPRPSGSAGGGRAGDADRRRPPLRTSARVATAAALAAVVIAGVGTALLLVKPAPAPTPGATVASPVRGVTSTEIVLGMASPFSGANRELGHNMKAGIEAAFAEVNASGGVHGRRLRLVALDDGYEPSRTGAVMRQLVEGEQVFAVVGNVGTPTAAVAVPYCTEHRVPFVGALSGGEILRNEPPDRYVFNFRPSYAEETAAAVRYLVDTLRIPPGRIAVFAQEDGFGESGWRGASAQLRERGVPPSRVVRVGYKRNTADVADAVAAVKKRTAELDAVVMIATYKAAATFIRRLRDAGLGLITTNVSPVDANALAEELVAAGPRYADGVMVTQIVPLPASSEPGVAAFRAALEKYAPGERPGFLTLEGWVVGHLLAEGVRRAGADVDPEKLVTALEEIRDLDLGIGTPISFAPGEHQGSHKVWGTVLQRDGTWKQIDLE